VVDIWPRGARRATLPGCVVSPRPRRPFASHTRLVECRPNAYYRAGYPNRKPVGLIPNSGSDVTTISVLQNEKRHPASAACVWKTPALLAVLGAVATTSGFQQAPAGNSALPALIALGLAALSGWAYAISLHGANRRREADQTQLRTAMEGALAGVYIIQGGVFRYVNAALCEMFGYEKRDVVDRLGPDALVHPDDRALVASNITKRLSGEVEVVHYTFRGLHRSGATLLCEALGRRVLYRGRPAIVGTLVDVTARQQAERRLAHERELLRALIENIPDTIYFKDTDLRFVRINPAQAEVLGVESPEEAVGRTDFDFFPVEFALESYVDDRHVIDTGQPIVGKLEVLADEDGEVRWLSASKVAIRDTEGEINGMVGITRDMTDRYRIEQAERDQRALAEALRDTAQALTSTLDLDDVLDRILENLGRVIPHDMASIMLLEDGISTIVRARGQGPQGEAGQRMSGRQLSLDKVAGLRRMVRKGEPLVIPDVKDYPDWVSFPPSAWVRSHAAAPIMFGDETLGFITVDSARPGFFSAPHGEHLRSFASQAAIAIRNARLYSELEDHNAALERAVAGATTELRQTLKRQRAILHSSPDAILTLDAAGKIDSANPAFDDLFGYTFEAVTGQPLTRLVDPADAARLSGVLDDVARTRQVRRIELVALRAGGAAFDANVSLAPIEENEALTGIVCTLWDISPTKEVERMKNAFVSNAAHELRTPLTSIHGYAELLLSRELDEERWRRYLTFIHEQSKHLSRIVNDLFDIAHFESSRSIELHLEPVDVAHLIEEVVARFEGTSSEHEIVHRIEKGLPRVAADPLRLSQALRNLVSNALKYSPDGGKIEVRAGSQGDNLLVEVHDEGIGIEQGKQAAIFDKFYRADDSDTAVGGTGLGLTIVKHIIRLHGGAIWVESEPGKGSTFSFTIPFGSTLPDN
jgi:PAS domain S-box-containing protein